MGSFQAPGEQMKENKGQIGRDQGSSNHRFVFKK
jgi:hypothetical protein